MTYKAMKLGLPSTKNHEAQRRSFLLEAFAIIFVLQGLSLQSHIILPLSTTDPGHYLCNTNTDCRLFLLIVSLPPEI